METVQTLHICTLYKQHRQNRLSFLNVLQEICENNPQSLQSLDSHLLSIMHYAVHYNDIETVCFILEKQTSLVNIEGVLRRTPLFFSTDKDMTALLVANGGNLDHVDEEGNLSFHCLLERCSLETISYQIDHIKLYIWNGVNACYRNNGLVSVKDLYHHIFPEERENDGEDEEIRDYMKTTNDIDMMSSINSITSVNSIESINGEGPGS